jgi:hypothetical protein
LPASRVLPADLLVSIETHTHTDTHIAADHSQHYGRRGWRKWLAGGEKKRGRGLTSGRGWKNTHPHKKNEEEEAAAMGRSRGGARARVRAAKTATM